MISPMTTPSQTANNSPVKGTSLDSRTVTLAEDDVKGLNDSPGKTIDTISTSVSMSIQPKIVTSPSISPPPSKCPGCGESVSGLVSSIGSKCDVCRQSMAASCPTLTSKCTACGESVSGFLSSIGSKCDVCRQSMAASCPTLTSKCTACSEFFSNSMSSCKEWMAQKHEKLKTSFLETYEADPKKAFLYFGLPVIVFVIMLVTLIVCLVLLLPQDDEKKSSKITLIYPSNQTFVLTPGEYYIAESEDKELYKITKVMPSTEETISVARSYDAYHWESLNGESPMDFDCTILSGFCTVVITEDDDGTYYEVSSVNTKLSSSMDESSVAATLLMQATFGQTRESIADYLTTYSGDPTSWITAQMNEPMWSHREYYRKRANTRLDVATTVGGIRMPCDTNSRWHRFAFTEEDIGKTVVVSQLSPNTLLFSIDDVRRTEVSTTDYNTTVNGWSFDICSVEEFLNGEVEIGEDDDCDVEISNPIIELSYQDVDYLLLNQSDYDDFTELSDVVDIFLFQGSSTDFTTCDSPIVTPLFVYTSYGALKYDPRIVTLTNTIEVPIDHSASSEQDCPVVAKTFLNIDGCIADRDTCAPILYSSALFELNETMIRNFYTIAGKYVYYVTGLRLADDDVNTPCDGDTSRWVNRKNATTVASSCDTTFANETVKAIIINKLRSTGSDDDDQVGVSRVREISITCEDDSDALLGARVLVDGECWEHAHPEEFNVYDFSIWTRAHPGGASPIEQFAIDEDPKIRFPSWHAMSRWSTGEAEATLLGKLGEVIDFSDLESSVQDVDIATLVGAVGARSTEGFEVCGSPGEVANDPTLGNMYRLLLGDDTNAYDIVLDQAEDPSFVYQKSVVWTSVSFKATDQLRQRVAWALSQIFVVTQDGANLASNVESFSVYYDIFVRHAFGNYRDILREVSYSPMMARMLTYLQSKSFAYSEQYPDENYAREIMQLFTIGLSELNEDGTLEKDSKGDPIPTYGNDDILNFARAWTGFDLQASRGNIEAGDIDDYNNYIDPMQLKSSWRDVLPKKDLSDGYIGDGYPLCSTRPSTQFLKKGAVYRYRGQNPLPELIEDPTSYGDDNDNSIIRFNLNKSTSSLYAFLCNSTAVSDVYNDEKCNFKSQVVLTENLECDGIECDVDTIRVVRMNYTNNGSTVPVYYEYVQEPCVSFPFYENATTISNRGGAQWDSSPTCAEKGSLEAMGTCCSSDSNLAVPTECKYYGEKVTFDTAQARCEADGLDLCSFKRSSDSDCLDSLILWSTRNCSTNVQIDSEGLITIVHASELEWTTEMPLDSGNSFEVKWFNDSYPTVDSTGCDGCTISGETCYCQTDIISTPVFTNTVPTRRQIIDQLHVGAFDPNLFDGQFLECISLSDQNVTIYALSSSSSSVCDDIVLDVDVVFEIKDQVGDSVFYLNLVSTVQVADGAYEFRNPPAMLSFLDPTVRDTQHEVEAVLDHYLNHKNTPPFVAYRMIQRFVSSNPSPRYIKAVATAFKTGTYASFGTGKRGDLAATIAAVLLDREARSTTLLHDPTHGQIREPLIKLIHLLRAMEYDHAPLHTELDLRTEESFGQMAYRAPNVFSFFHPDYQPAGPVATAALVSPEAQLLTAPYIVGFINGALSLIKWGLSDCYQGFTLLKGNSCGLSTSLAEPQEDWAGNLSYMPTSTLTSTADIISEIDLLLTGGRMNADNKDLIEGAYDATMAESGTTSFDALQTAQQLFVMSPEFHTTNINKLTQESRVVTPNETETTAPENYKAVVYLYFGGAIDSYNILVPYEDCNGTDLYAQYVEVREDVALSKSDLHSIEVPNSTQPCDVFGVHGSLDIVKSLYDDGDALFFANVGPLVEPITKAEYEDGTKQVPESLFSHNKQELAAHTVHAQEISSAKGVIGRMMDALTIEGYSTGSYSIFGNIKVLEPETSDDYDVIDRTNGVIKLDSSGTSPDIISLMTNLTSFVSESIYAETWSQKIRATKERTESLYNALNTVELEQDFDADDTTIGKQFQQIAYLIKANQETIHNDRDAFYVRIGGFDTHSDLYETLEENLDEVNAALTSFIEEMKLQGMWGNVTILAASEFGRTLTSNGLGTDHAWAGNTFMLGGSVCGGQILGDFPSDLTEDGPLNIGRGRLIPTTSWEAVWNAIGGWMGVDDDNLFTMLPNLANFEAEDVFSSAEAFTDERTCRARATVVEKSSSSQEEVWTETTVALVASSSVLFFFMMVAAAGFIYFRYYLNRNSSTEQENVDNDEKHSTHNKPDQEAPVIGAKTPKTKVATMVSNSINSVRSTLDRHRNRESSLDRPTESL